MFAYNMLHHLTCNAGEGDGSVIAGIMDIPLFIHRRNKGFCPVLGDTALSNSLVKENGKGRS